MKEKSFVSKLLRNQNSFFDTVLSKDGYWEQTALSVALALVFLFIYAGLSISIFGWEQALLSGLKLVILFASSIALCFPTFYIFSAFRGSELEIKELVGMFSGFMMYISLLLVALLPINWLFAFSGSDHDFLSFLFFLFNSIALFTGISFLKKGVFYLNEKLEGKVGKGFLNVWIIVFILVLLQMASNLGPWFTENKALFREERKNFLETAFEDDYSYDYDYDNDYNYDVDVYYE